MRSCLWLLFVVVHAVGWVWILVPTGETQIDDSVIAGLNTTHTKLINVHPKTRMMQTGFQILPQLNIYRPRNYNACMTLAFKSCQRTENIFALLDNRVCAAVVCRVDGNHNLGDFGQNRDAQGAIDQASNATR